MLDFLSAAGHCFNILLAYLTDKHSQRSLKGAWQQSFNPTRFCRWEERISFCQGQGWRGQEPHCYCITRPSFPYASLVHICMERRQELLDWFRSYGPRRESRPGLGVTDLVQELPAWSRSYPSASMSALSSCSRQDFLQQ